MTTEIVKFDEVIQNSGLAIQEGEEIKQSYLPFAIQLAEIQEQSTKINFENPTPTDELIARDLRLRTVKIRTGASDLKDSRKKIHLLKGNLEQAAYNLIAASCKLSEETFTTVEKAREIAEAKRQSELNEIRASEIIQFSEFIPYGLNLGKMTEPDYQKLLSGAKMQMTAKIEAEKKAEADRIAAEQVRLAEEKRIREENERLRKEAEAKDQQIAEERAKAMIEKLAAEEKARKEREAAEAVLKAEREARAKVEADILAKAEAERKAAEEKARKEREAAEAVLKAEREARAKVEADILAKAEAERKAAEEKAIADKKAQSAPDKQKLISLSAAILATNMPELKSIEAIAILESVKELLKKTSEFITKKVGEL